MNNQKGILLIACGHPNYGRMSAVLAASIKAVEPETKIHLAYTESAIAQLTTKELELFSSKKKIAKKYYTNNGKVEWIRTKMFMYELSPFAETLFLDSDLIWLQKSPSQLFTELVNSEVSYSNSGVATKSLWASIDDIKSAYDVKEVLDLQSEFMYFKKGDRAKHFFSTAQDVYDNLKIKATVFAGAIPDELPFSIAASLTKTKPHQQPYRPVWWKAHERRSLHSYQIAKDYYAISMGGAHNELTEIIMYNLLAKAAYYKLGLHFPYQWKQKRTFLKERQTI